MGWKSIRDVDDGEFSVHGEKTKDWDWLCEELAIKCGYRENDQNAPDAKEQTTLGGELTDHISR